MKISNNQMNEKLIFNQMKSNSRIHKQEQVQVVIRLKPEAPQNKHQRCAYLASEDSNALVVQVPNKKEYFVFDAIANQHTSQFELYQNIGRQAVLKSLEGYNCCIFAYGQTGSGKTYSILGVLQDIVQNIFTETRGILPRLLEDLFKTVKSSTDKIDVRCSYMEIYNEQIFDLSNESVQFLQIREGPQRGVYVQGINNFTIKTYQESINLLLQGEKNRKIAETGMNKQSSRSHTIFTINIESQIIEEDAVKFRRSKINIVDLAGSQRVKHTNVEGDRLRQGCNINKSLHVLGNVINALVESTKKKKHIPFRDSKLTYYLKDSLGGNSVTKLLANIQCNSKYLGDTLSTLMFAKRAKILKMKVQVNQNTSQNYDVLRKQIKKLRQQLAQAKYINQTRLSDRFQTENETELNIEKYDTSNFQYSSADKPIQIFQENQLNYKALIEIYEEHMKQCSSLNNQNFNTANNSFTKKKTANILSHSEWKKLQKKNAALMNLIKRVPAFTKIYRENQLLKQQRTQDTKLSKVNKDLFRTQHKIPAHSTTQSFSESTHIEHQSFTPTEQQEEIIQRVVQKTVEQYQTIITEMKGKFNECLNDLDRSYLQMQKQIEEKDKRIKEISKRHFQLPPNIEELIDENQYLKLNILQLQSELSTLDKQLEQTRIKQKQEGRRYSLFQEPMSSKKLKPFLEDQWMTQSLTMLNPIDIAEVKNQNDDLQKLIQNSSQLQLCKEIMNSLENFKKQASQQAENYNLERQAMIDCIQALQKQCKSLIHTNKSITLKNEDLKVEKNLIIGEIQKKYPDISIQTIYKLQPLKSNEDLWKQITDKKNSDDNLEIYKNETQFQIQSLYNKLNQMEKIKQQLNEFVMKEKATEKEFGKPISQILQEYAQFVERNLNQPSVSLNSRNSNTASQNNFVSPRGSKVVGQFSGNIKSTKQYSKKNFNLEGDFVKRETIRGNSKAQGTTSQEKNLIGARSPKK